MSQQYASWNLTGDNVLSKWSNINIRDIETESALIDKNGDFWFDFL